MSGRKAQSLKPCRAKAAYVWSWMDMCSVRRKEETKMNSKFEKAVAPSAPKEYGVLGIVGSSKEPTYFGQAKERQKLEVEIARLRAENDAMRSALDVMEGTLATVRSIK